MNKAVTHYSATWREKAVKRKYGVYPANPALFSCDPLNIWGKAGGGPSNPSSRADEKQLFAQR